MYTLYGKFTTHNGWYCVSSSDDLGILNREIEILLKDKACTEFRVEIVREK